MLRDSIDKLCVCVFLLSQKAARKEVKNVPREVYHATVREERKKIPISLSKNLQCRKGAAKGAGDKCITNQIPSHTDRESLHELRVKSDIESSGERLYKLTEASSSTKRTSFFQMLIFVMLAQNRSWASSKTQRPICYLSICDCFKKECVI